MAAVVSGWLPGLNFSDVDLLDEQMDLLNPPAEGSPAPRGSQSPRPATTLEALELALDAVVASVAPLQGAPRTPPEVLCAAGGECSLERAASWAIRELRQADCSTLPLKEVVAAVARARDALDLPRLSDADMYVAVTPFDAGGCHVLDAEGLAGALGAVLEQWAKVHGRQGEKTPSSTPRRLVASPPAPPSSPAEAVELVVRTLAGLAFEVSIPGIAGATTEDLELAIARSPAGMQLGQPLWLSCNGRVLAAGERLQDHGLAHGYHVDVVRVTPPPTLVRLECEGFGCGPSIRGSCGTFRLADGRRKNGRPIYVRDNSLSSWNSAMLYHGAGNRYLLFEESVEKGGRWALTDDQDWSGYGDRCYAFVPLRVPHPAYLEGRGWHVYRDAKYEAKKVWVEHPSLRLAVEEESQAAA